MPADYVEARPRTSGEILDDAWRMALGNYPFLLVITGLFWLPAAAAMIWLLTQSGPAVGWRPIVAPALAAILLPVTGLGCGACQEAFHCWAEEVPATVWQCVAAALRRGLNHVTSQALVVLVPLAGILGLVLPGLPGPVRGLILVMVLVITWLIQVFAAGRHVVLAAGQANLWRAWRTAARASGRHPGRASLIVTSRFLLLALALFNLHLFAGLALWMLENLAGFELALVASLFSLGNTTYVLLLTALAWWLLAPFTEGAHYLLFVDARTRYEGLDLWYRVEQFFPRRRSSSVAVLVVLGSMFAGAGAVRAQDRLQDVHNARQEITAIRQQIQKADPYPGGKRWRPALRQVGKKLDPQGNSHKGRFRWLHQAVDQFGSNDRAADLKAIDKLADRLHLVEESLRPADADAADSPLAKEKIKSLLPPLNSADQETRPKKPPPEKKKKELQPEDDPDGPIHRRGRGGPGLVAPVSLGGAGNLLLYLVIGVLLAVVMVGLVVAIHTWQQNRRKRTLPQQGQTPPAVEDFLDEPERLNVSHLWGQADDLARAGKYLDAVRILYLAVLALLHQAGLIRYERTRTNGEYADQLRTRIPLHAPFLNLTGLFEWKWYGERSCQGADFQACRGLAETIRTGMKNEE